MGFVPFFRLSPDAIQGACNGSFIHSGQQLFMEPYGHHTACGGHYQCGMWKIIAIMPAVQLEFGVASAVGFGRLIADISHWFLKRRGIVMAMAIVASGNYLSGSIWTLVLADTLNTQGWCSVYMFLAIVTLAVVIPTGLHLAPQTTRSGPRTGRSSIHRQCLSIRASPNGISWDWVNIAIMVWLLMRGHPRNVGQLRPV